MRTAVGPCPVPSGNAPAGCGQPSPPLCRAGGSPGARRWGGAQRGPGRPCWGGGSAGGALGAPALGVAPPGPFPAQTPSLSTALRPPAPCLKVGSRSEQGSALPGSPSPPSPPGTPGWPALAHGWGRCHPRGPGGDDARCLATGQRGRPGLALASGLVANRNFKGSMKLRLSCSLAKLRWGWKHIGLHVCGLGSGNARGLG